MTKDKKILYLTSAGICTVLLSCLFIPGDVGGKVFAAFLLVPLAFLCCFLIRKRRTPSINKKTVLLITSISALIFISLYYISGSVFGFYRYPFLILNIFLGNLIPITAIIVSIEIIRCIILAQQKKLSSILIYVSGVVTDVLIFTTLAEIDSFYEFMETVGLYFFPAITANILFGYLAKRYGAYPSIAFRLIMSLYLYIIPIRSAIPDALLSMAKIAVPLLVLLFVDALFEKKKHFALKKKNKWRFLPSGILLILMISLVMIISNKFQYGAFVISTESMTGEINKGDLAIYKTLDEDDVIEIGDVIVYTNGKSSIIHRVVDMEKINGETRYYTKGDANEDVDFGYVTKANIVGKIQFKIIYLGYPTLLLRDLFG